MKRKMTWLLGAITFAAVLSRAQDEPAPQQSVEPVASAVSSSRQQKTAAPTPVIPNLYFEGGTVRDLIRTLKETGRKAGLLPLNVITASEVETETVPKLELHNVGYADVFQALNKMNAVGMGDWQLSTTGESSIWVLKPGPAQMLAFASIDPLTGQPLGRGIGGTPPEPPKNCQVYQLQRYLTKYKVEDITTAIHTAWGMVGLEKGAELKYHKDTSLLIAVGRQDQLEIITRVLHSLDEGLAISGPAKKVVGEVFVNGAVNRPGSVALGPEQEIDILTALARSGGLTQRANENKITFTRPGETEETFTLKQLKQGPKYNIPLKPGDIVEVFEKNF